jgi:CRISPR-associated protein Cas1
MTKSWWRAEPHDLHRVSDRVSMVYVERTHIDRDENALVFINKEQAVRLPAAFLAVVLVGPGTRITGSTRSSVVGGLGFCGWGR